MAIEKSQEYSFEKGESIAKVLSLKDSSKIPDVSEVEDGIVSMQDSLLGI